MCQQRDYVVPDDVKELAIPSLAHRIVVRGLIRDGRRERAIAVLRRILDQTRVPS